MLRFVLHTQIHGCLFGVWCSFDSVHGAAVSLELGGRLHYTHVYIQMACKERENERVLYLPSQLGDDGATPSSSRPIGWRRRLSHIPPFALLLAPLLAAVYLASCCILLHIFVLICINIVPSLSAFYKKYGSSTLCSLHGMVTPSRHSYSIRNHNFIPFNFKYIRYFFSGFSMCDYSK